MLPGKRCIAGFSRNAASSAPGSMPAFAASSSVKYRASGTSQILLPRFGTGSDGKTKLMTDPVRETARGRADDTPARALAGVTITIAVVAGLLIVALLILWYALK